MREPKAVVMKAYLKRLPPLWSDTSLRTRISRHNAETRRCIVVLDDDPTGTQTVHDVLVLTRWEVDDLKAAIRDGGPAFYILTNSRSLSLAEAQRVNREIAINLASAARTEDRAVTLVSRSDSTLRGHFPGEVEALSQAWKEATGETFDGVCIVPFFLEGGRYTVDGVHWVEDKDRLVPAAQSPYSQDPVFGYRNSWLPAWVEEKTKGAVRSSAILSIPLVTIRKDGPLEVARRLRGASNGRIVIVNAADERDLEVFVFAIQQLETEGKRFLFRTAASFVKIYAGQNDRPLLTREEIVGDRPAGGALIVFGSHVPRSTEQLASVKALDDLVAIELPVERILDESGRESFLLQVSASLDKALREGNDALVYTSRTIVRGENQAANLEIARTVSAALVSVTRQLSSEPRYVIGKGGITSSDIATDGMDVVSSRVLGQVLPGVPVWRLGHQSRWPGLPFIVFPGNVGEVDSVTSIVKTLRS